MYNTAVMTSGVLHSRFPYLQFAVAGFPGSEGLQLEVKSGGTSSVVAPASPPGEAWKEIAVAKSSVDFSVSARDDSHTQWLAFAPPVEIGRLSQWTRGLLAASPFLLFAVLAAICFLILFTWLIRAQAVERGNNTDSGSPAADAV